MSAECAQSQAMNEKSPSALLLKQLRDRAGMTVRELAAALDMPTTTYSSYEGRYKKRFLPMEMVMRLVPILAGRGAPPIAPEEVMALGFQPDLSVRSMPVPDSIMLSRKARATQESPEPAPNAGPSVEMPAVATMPRDVPVYGTAVGGIAADFDFNGQIVDYVRRPPGIMHARSVFAIFVSGDSMSPRYEEGDLVYLRPDRPPRPGDDIVIEMWPKDNGEHVTDNRPPKNVETLPSNLSNARPYDGPIDLQGAILWACNVLNIDVDARSLPGPPPRDTLL